MDFNAIIDDLTQHKLAARRYEKAQHSKFRDMVTVCRNGKLRFERFCYGEAAGSVCVLWANGLTADGQIDWDMAKCLYSGKEEAPKELTAVQDGALEFDGKGRLLWEAKEDFKTLPEAGLGRLNMLFSR